MKKTLAALLAVAALSTSACTPRHVLIESPGYLTPGLTSWMNHYLPR